MARNNIMFNLYNSHVLSRHVMATLTEEAVASHYSRFIARAPRIQNIKREKHIPTSNEICN
jgi:hypothetical protein